MDRINLIINNQKYLNHLKKNRKHEKKRIYCKHNLQHFLDVARIAYIYNLESGLNIEKDLIYATALLHDIGKWQQYESKIPHCSASALLSQEILEECGFVPEEIEKITSAILTHRSYPDSEAELNLLIYRADKQSRRCFACKAYNNCDWPDEKKNKGINI